MACCDNNINYFAPRWSSFLDFVPTVPQLYWNVDGNEQRYHLLCKQLHKLVCYADMLGVKINVDHETIEKLEAEFEKFKESGFLDYYEKQLEEWINLHMPTLIAQAMKMVWFGLTGLDNEYPGHFIAYIPESWQDITFDTYMTDNDYGCLILVYDADAGESYYSPSNSYDVLDEILNGMAEEIETQSQNITTIEGNITAIEGNITTIEGNITTIEGNITTIEGNITTIEGNITTIEGSVENIEEDISTIQQTLYTDMGE